MVANNRKNQVGSAISREQGYLVLLVCTVNAAGNLIPLKVIFPQVNFSSHFVNTGPQSCIGAADRSKWINEKLILTYFNHLIQYTQCSNDRKILLLDNHKAHISLQAIEKGWQNGIIMLTIPPKALHRFQPMDVAVFFPFKNAYNRAMDNWMINHPRHTITI